MVEISEFSVNNTGASYDDCAILLLELLFFENVYGFEDSCNRELYSPNLRVRRGGA